MRETKRTQSKRLPSSGSARQPSKLSGATKSGRIASVPAKGASSKSQKSDIGKSHPTDVISKKTLASPSNRIAIEKHSSTKRILPETKTQNKDKDKSKETKVGTRTSRARTAESTSSKSSSSDKSSSKSTKSSRNSGRGGASRGGGGSGSKIKENQHFIVMGVLALAIIIMAIVKFSGGSHPPAKTVYVLDPIREGFAHYEKAKQLYKASNTSEALAECEKGFSTVTNYLDSQRDSNGNLPRNLAGYEGKLAEWIGFRKILREQNLIDEQQKKKQ